MSRRPQTPKAAPVDLHHVERLAALSRLSLGPQEAARLGKELSSILEHFATIDKVDVSKSVPAAPQSREEGGGLREDVVKPSRPDEILAGVPQMKGRYVKAPRVF